MLLCGGCHDRVTRRLLSKETIRLKSLLPKCKEQGFSFGPFDIGMVAPEIIIGNFKGKNVGTLIRISGDDILSVKNPSEEGLPFLINAYLCDSDGNEVLKIVDNEWQTPTSNWDVEVISTRITIRKKRGKKILVLRSEPPNRLVVEKMDMVHKGNRISCKEGKDIEITTSNGIRLKSSKIEIEDCKVGIEIESDSLVIGKEVGSVIFSGIF